MKSGLTTLLIGLMLAGTAPASDFDQHLTVANFNPADREPIPGYQERVDRVMTDMQDFFRSEMERNGHGPLTFPLERDADGKLVIQMVQSKKSYAKGSDVTWGDITGQVKLALAERGIDMERAYVITFQNLLFTDESGKISGPGSYWGTGDQMHGHATVVDHEFIDPANLLKTEPIVQDGRRKLPLGEYVMTQIGGLGQKLGHSFGLPHNRETAEERKTFGTAIMGTGNYTYRRERAGQGPGSILTPAHAQALTTHPLFARKATDRMVKPSCEMTAMRFEGAEQRLAVTGRLKSSLPIAALIAYLDPAKGRRDYDSRSWVATCEPDGRFEVVVEGFEPDGYELRLRFYHSNGAFKVFKCRFAVDESGRMQVRHLNRQFVYETRLLPAYEARDTDLFKSVMARLTDIDDVWHRKARLLHKLLTEQTEPQMKLEDVGTDVRSMWLSLIVWESAEVGWGKPARDRRADAGYLLESGDEVHATGLYAHAASKYVYRLDGRWKTLESAFGLQNWSPGSVVFVVKGDGKELFRSDVVKGWKEGNLRVDLAGVEKLELIVENARDGAYGDNAIWFSPRLSR